MQCPNCGADNANEAGACVSCGGDLAQLNATAARPGVGPRTGDEFIKTTQMSAPSLPRQSPMGPQSRPSGSQNSRVVVPGMDLGERYHIVQQLGEGGMGEVFLARDRELDRDVALKVIRIDLANNPAILERFKREIQLSSNVTHKNILRVYDLGEVAGVKFLTMQYIEGRDLASLMRHETLPLQRVIAIFHQICDGLQAAHEQGIIHRDLKPQNILIDERGKVSIADFGLAKSVDYASLTEAGRVIGTPHYMSPEQVKGVALDPRSDIYSLGIILYEMLTGTVPFTGSSAYEVMVQRTQRPPRPASDHNPKIPPYLNKILDKCLQADPKLRYSSVAEILHDLDTRVVRSSLQYHVRKGGKWSAAIAALAVVALIGGGIAAWRTRSGGGSQQQGSEATHAPVSVLIADVSNETGEPVFDGTVEPILALAMEGASFVSSYSRGNAQRVAGQIQQGATALDERMARLVAVREGVNVVVTGAIRKSNSYVIALRAIDGATGNEIAKSETEAQSKDQVLAAVGRGAADIRKALGDTTPVSAQMAAAETFTAGSLDAAHEYAIGQDLFYRGKFDDAVLHFQLAIKLDPDLGRAYAGLATAYGNMGRMSDMEAELKSAMSHSNRMTDREKYRTRANYYLLIHNNSKAIEELTELLKHYPADVSGLNNLAFAYFNQRDMAKAMEASEKPIALYPNNVVGRNNAALYAMYAGNFPKAVEQAQKVITINPKYEKAYLAVGLSRLAQGDVAGATNAYQKLASLSPRGESMAAMALADVALYEGRVNAAVAILTPSVTTDQTAKRSDAANQKTATIANCTRSAAKADEVAQNAGASPDPHALFTAARALIATNHESSALRIAKLLQSRIEAEQQMYGKLIEGEILLQRGDARNALSQFEAARNLADSWLAHFDRGRAYLDLGAFTEAGADFESCLKRKGESTAVFLNDIPTYHYFPPVHYYLGRTQEGLGNAGAADSYKQFLAIKTKSDGDPLVADARRRLDAAAKPLR